MKLSRKRLIILITGITVFLVAFGVAFAGSHHPTWQVWQKKDGTATLNPLNPLSGDAIDVSFDRTGDQTVLTLRFDVWETTPPVRGWARAAPIMVWFHNDSNIIGPPVDLRPIGPCQPAKRLSDDRRVGWIDAEMWNAAGQHKGHACNDDWDPVKDVIPPGGTWKMNVWLGPHEELRSGDKFNVIFAAVGTGAPAP